MAITDDNAIELSRAPTTFSACRVPGTRGQDGVGAPYTAPGAQEAHETLVAKAELSALVQQEKETAAAAAAGASSQQLPAGSFPPSLPSPPPKSSSPMAVDLDGDPSKHAKKEDSSEQASKGAVAELAAAT